MQKKDVRIGATYEVKVSGVLAPVKITCPYPSGGWGGLNLRTNKTVRIKTAQRLRRCLATTQARKKTAAMDQPVSPRDGGDASGWDITYPSARCAEVAAAAVPQERNPNACATPGCGGEVHLTSLGQPMCKECWDRACEEADAAGSAESKAELAATVANAEAGNLAQGLIIPMASKRKRNGKSLLDVAAMLLARQKGEAFKCREILRLAVGSGLWTPRDGKTPANTLYSAILREMKTKGEASRFAKAGPGEFTFVGEGA